MCAVLMATVGSPALELFCEWSGRGTGRGAEEEDEDAVIFASCRLAKAKLLQGSRARRSRSWSWSHFPNGRAGYPQARTNTSRRW